MASGDYPRCDLVSRRSFSCATVSLRSALAIRFNHMTFFWIRENFRRLFLVLLAGGERLCDSALGESSHELKWLVCWSGP
jgi:hypothetical protein